MAHHLICLTIDIDPDGLSDKITNRSSRHFDCFEKIMNLSYLINDKLNLEVPFTWFVRIDDQIKEFFGTEFYLISKYEKFFHIVKGLNHEVGWHPHIYVKRGENFILPESDSQACDLISNMFKKISSEGLKFTSFRNGEGWHSNATIRLMDKLGFKADSTAIPGLKKEPPHLLNWEGTQNKPYFPSDFDYRLCGVPRTLVEIPMTTWMVKAPYDSESKLRYMNPAIHSKIFKESININKSLLNQPDENLIVWTFISHPDELCEGNGKNPLHGKSMDIYINNVFSFIHQLRNSGQTFRFTTITEAAIKWKSK